MASGKNGERSVLSQESRVTENFHSTVLLPRACASLLLKSHMLFNLMQSHLFIFSFISLALGNILAKILLHEISEILLPVFSARIFMVSQLTFKSFLHFEFILV